MTILTIAGSGAAFLAAIAAAPLALPNAVHVERAAIIEARPETLYRLIASNAGYQTFNPYRTADPALEISLFGPDFGIGSGFAFDGKDGKGTQVVALIEENRSVTMEIDLGAMGKPTQTFRLDPVGTGTRVTWGMDMEFGLNPIGRVMGLFMDRMVGGTYETGLANLADVAQSAARPDA
ncbi:SRPBCC family protein [Jannaschia aquimarina]|uniref:Polyketide cyclase / dehydrase and lipid transport n=1 Tax=Jannaschia aquimarina TaxID=935700 RepID=A0A0D1EFX7_9RHOB|nr:SRPBCC family protein [Jannaschia aquimarina]KIT15776.1 Polyketide cyclase / dehydrase and lipid transport [Jannaschia aquimarina]SNT31641.1 Polyketide cyclase / dehydrase and lipid transport [Jannaschia aquimarina]